MNVVVWSGPKGATGDTGARGQQGATGANGEAGKPGLAGAQGTGSTGSVALPLNPGLRGYPGPRGPPGDAGHTGASFFTRTRATLCQRRYESCNKCIVVRKVATPLRELTCHTGSHSVTCHPAEVTFPSLPQPKLVLD